MFSMQQRQRLSRTFATVLLLLASHPSASACISDTTVIFYAERQIYGSTEVSTLRRYVLCPDTVYDIGEYSGSFYGSAHSTAFVDGMAALFLYNPNVEISCGEDGKRSNNCVLRGEGESLAFYLMNSGEFFDDFKHSFNVAVRGVTFRGAGGVIVDNYEEMMGEVLFEDCVFEENTHYSSSLVQVGTYNEKLSLVFDSCTFDSNKYIDRNIDGVYGGSNFATLMCFVGTKTILRNCDFRNNVVKSPWAADDLQASDIISSVILQEFGTMDVEGCTFEYNEVSSALVIGHNSTITIGKGNSAVGNSFFATGATDQSCNGVGTVIDENPFKMSCEEFGSGAGSDSGLADVLAFVSSGKRPIATNSLLTCLLAAVAAVVATI